LVAAAATFFKTLQNRNDPALHCLSLGGDVLPQRVFNRRKNGPTLEKVIFQKGMMLYGN